MTKFWYEGSPNKNSSLFSLIGTVVFWALLFLCAMFIKPVVREPKYKEVQIVLEPFSIQKKTELAEKIETPAASSAAPASADSEPVVKTQEKSEPVNKAEPVKKSESVKKSEPVKTDAVSKKEVAVNKSQPVKKDVPLKKQPATPVPEPVYSKSVEELMEEQMSVKQKNNSFEDVDWDSLFEEDSEEKTVVQNNTVTSKNTMWGSAGELSESAESGAVSQSKNQKNTGQSVSQNTQNALSGIRNSKFVNGTDLYDSEVDIKAEGSQGTGVRVSMSNGYGRVLISPKEPKIIISEENARLITGTITVKITFTVMESGNVPRVYIQISQSALLPASVIDEIKDQLKEWRFETADYQAAASFDFTIVKK